MRLANMRSEKEGPKQAGDPIIMEKNYTRIILRWLLVLVYCLAVFYFSSSRPTRMLFNLNQYDKIVHFVAFLFLGILAYRAIKIPDFEISKTNAVLLTFIFSVIFGVLIEVNQFFIPYRSAELGDIVADMLGNITGILCYLPFSKGLTKDS